MEHPLLTRIRREGFEALGWFEPAAEDPVPGQARFVILIGNAGPAMFRRFARERDPQTDSLDEWTRDTVGPMAKDLDAEALYPFDTPPLPFLTWARKAGAGHVSPLGLNIHPTYGLWHAYRAALLFPVAFDMPPPARVPHPCEACAEKPCLSACPVSAFDGQRYEVARCAAHLRSGKGEDCMADGCKARRACPVGRAFTYESGQTRFHMQSFLLARLKDNT